VGSNPSRDARIATNGYRLYARSEGKSENAIRVTVTALNGLKDFLESREYSTDVIEIGTRELRGFILHLQPVKAVHSAIPGHLTYPILQS
jgi:hypothetical protein